MGFKEKLEQVKQQSIVIAKKTKDVSLEMVDKTKEKIDDEVERRRDIADQKRLDEEDNKEEQRLLRELFNPNEVCEDLEIDFVNKLFIVKNAKVKESRLLKSMTNYGTALVGEEVQPEEAHIFSFTDLIEYELVEDGIRIFTGGYNQKQRSVTLDLISKRKLKRVIESLVLNIKINDSDYATLVIPYISKPIKTVEESYLDISKTAQESLIALEMIVKQLNEDWFISQENNQTSKPLTKDVLDELKKLKELLDVEIITQEEFDIKKKQILGI